MDAQKKTEQSKMDYEKAVDFFTLGKYEDAIGVFKIIIQNEPNYRDAYESLGMVYFKMGKLDDAIEWTEKLVKLFPGYAMAHTNLSVFYMKKGLKEKAEDEKAKAVVLNFGKK